MCNCKHLSITQGNGQTPNKCDINNNGDNIKDHLKMKEKFESLHPGHIFIPNGECLFMNICDKLKQCPCYAKV